MEMFKILDSAGGISRKLRHHLSCSRNTANDFMSTWRRSHDELNEMHQLPMQKYNNPYMNVF